MLFVFFFSVFRQRVQVKKKKTKPKTTIPFFFCQHIFVSCCCLFLLSFETDNILSLAYLSLSRMLNSMSIYKIRNDLVFLIFVLDLCCLYIFFLLFNIEMKKKNSFFFIIHANWWRKFWKIRKVMIITFCGTTQ